MNTVRNGLLLLALLCAAIPVKAQEWDEEKIDKQERAEWFEARWNSGPAKDVEASRMKGIEQFRSMPSPQYRNLGKRSAAAIPAWKQIAGSQDYAVSGRASGVGFDPNNPAVLYLATPQGGLWKTTNRGDNWTYISGSWSKQVMGCVAVDPRNSNVVYAATGDADGGSLGGGIGIMKSTDGGLNWTNVATAGQSIVAAQNIIIDGTSPIIGGESSVIFVAGSGGIARSTDAGKTWTKKSAGITSLVMNSQDTKKLVAASSSITYSTDGGDTWVSATGGISGGRISLAISASDPNIVYASVSSSFSGVAKSTDGGVSWKWAQQNIGHLGQQGWYANAIAVNPYNPNDVVIGGLDIYRTQTGGATWGQITDWTVSSSASNFTHADIHVLTFNGNDLYALTDGGIYRSASGGTVWTQDLNKSLATLQFVGVDAPPGLSYVIGGAQDNGNNRAEITDETFHQTAGGDGGFTYVAQDDSLIVYSTYVNAVLRRSHDGGKTWEFGGQNVITDQRILNEGAPFYMQYAICNSYAPMVAIVGNSNVYLSQNGGADFEKITGTGTRRIAGPYSAHISDDQSMIYVGTSNGYVYATSDLGETWVKSRKSLAGAITTIVTHPDDPSKVYVSIGGQGGRHFAVSTDYGLTWATPDNNLPDLGANSISIRKDGVLFLANDGGVLYSADDGATWAPLRDGLPIVQVNTVRVRRNNLLAGTYGRGMFYMDISGITKDTPPVSGVKEAPTVASEDITVYPNPVSIRNASTTVGFTVKESGQVQLKVYDELGREQLTVMNEYKTAGDYTKKIDLSGVAKGQYFYVLISNGTSIVKPFVIGE